jgi:hypothetical protein
VQGCGTVEYATLEEAQNAINMFNGYEVCGVPASALCNAADWARPLLAAPCCARACV